MSALSRAALLQISLSGESRYNEAFGIERSISVKKKKKESRCAAPKKTKVWIFESYAGNYAAALREFNSLRRVTKMKGIRVYIVMHARVLGKV